jgi:glycosyltransferase involved in cell wall biosynthesis
MVKVSVVIPCYNQGIYLEEAVDSVLNQTFADFEILVVNDGSTDADTIKLLAGYRKPKTRIIHTDNQGVAAARNTGVKEARGEYILPLDADDKIDSVYLGKCVDILEKNPDIGIVYCLGKLFGAQERMINAPDFSIGKMLLSNLVFNSALFRKEDWRAVGGYNSNMKHGCEDWDFWLSLIERGRKVYRIPETLFHYRIKDVSRNTSMNREMQVEMHLQLMKNHPGLFVEHARPLLRIYYWITCSKMYNSIKRVKSLFPFLTKTGRTAGRHKK